MLDYEIGFLTGWASASHPTIVNVIFYVRSVGFLHSAIRFINQRCRFGYIDKTGYFIFDNNEKWSTVVS